MKIAVLAYNKAEFDTIVSSKFDKKAYNYITGNNYRGRSFDRLHITPLFWSRKDAREIFQEIQCCLYMPHKWDIRYLEHSN